MSLCIFFCTIYFSVKSKGI